MTREDELSRELRRLEELLQVRTHELEHANERLHHNERLALIGTLAAGIAHEINNPIGIILLAATNALEVSGEPEAGLHRDRALEKIRNHCAKIRQIVDSVRAFTATEPADKSPCSLNRAIRSATDLISGYAKDRGISCELALAEPLPELELISREIEHVFASLIRIAVEAAGRGSQITIRTESDSSSVRGVIQTAGSASTNHSEPRSGSSALSCDSLDEYSFEFGATREIVDSYGGSINIEKKADGVTSLIVSLPRNTVV